MYTGCSNLAVLFIKVCSAMFQISMKYIPFKDCLLNFGAALFTIEVDVTITGLLAYLCLNGEQVAMKEEEIRDEIYCQIIKQLTENKSSQR